MGKQRIIKDTTVRQGDVSANVDKDGTVTITVGGATGDPLDHEHMEMDSEHALRLSDVLANITTWTDDEV